MIDSLDQVVQTMDMLRPAGEYRMIGGVALDLLRGKITRPHNDIDLLVEETYVQEFLITAQENGFSVEREPWFVKLRSDSVKIDIWEGLRTQNHVMFGSEFDLCIPRKLYYASQNVLAQDRPITLAGNEILKALGAYSRHTEDYEFSLNLHTPDNQQDKVHLKAHTGYS